jgi:hypothetical protein
MGLDSYWKNTIDLLNKEHADEVANLITHLKAKTVSAAVEHEQKLDAQKSIGALTNACIQDELDAERAEHEVTRRKLQEKSLMLTQYDLKTEEAEHAATKLELHAAQTKLSIFNGANSIKALADHITEMQAFINKLKQRMVRAYGPLDVHTERRIKNLEDILMLKTLTDKLSAIKSP